MSDIVVTRGGLASVAERIRSARRSSGMSQQDLADALGIRRTAVTQWERPGGTVPSVSNLLQAAVVMRVSSEWLATGRGVKLLPQEEIPAFSTDCIAQSCDEEALLAMFRRLGLRQKDAVLTLLRSFSPSR